MRMGDNMKRICRVKLSIVVLIAVVMNGCTFIIKDDQRTKYYGVDEKRGSEYLGKILDRQQQVYQARKVSAEAQKP